MLALCPSVLAFQGAALAPGVRASVQMRTDDSFAPAGMGGEYVSQPRKPLSEYIGASQELAAFPGGETKPWDPMQFSDLYKVSGNNPDVAWLREAELKHGRMSMLAVTGIMVQSSGIYLPGNAEVDFSGAADWATAPTTLPLSDACLLLPLSARCLAPLPGASTEPSITPAWTLTLAPVATGFNRRPKSRL